MRPYFQMLVRLALRRHISQRRKYWPGQDRHLKQTKAESVGDPQNAEH
jgi:hypothetical protein